MEFQPFPSHLFLPLASSTNFLLPASSKTLLLDGMAISSSAPSTRQSYTPFIPSFSGTRGTFAVWSVDFRKDPLVAEKIASIPDTDNLNGMTAIQGLSATVLIADAGNSALRSLNTRTGKSQIVLQDPLFENSPQFPLGINGVETFGPDLYFTNSAKGIFGKVHVRSDGVPVGKVEHITSISSSEGSYDDFTMDKLGNGLLAVKPSAVNKVTRLGKQSILSGGPGTSEFSGPTSIVFGRGSRKEEATLYVSTCGLFDPVSGNWGGGSVMAIGNYQPLLDTTDSCWSFKGMKKAMGLLWRQQAAISAN